MATASLTPAPDLAGLTAHALLSIVFDARGEMENDPDPETKAAAVRRSVSALYRLWDRYEMPDPNAAELRLMLADARAAIDADPSGSAAFRWVIREQVVIGMMEHWGVPVPPRERAAHGQLPQDLADVYQPALLASLPSVCSHADSLVEVV